MVGSGVDRRSTLWMLTVNHQSSPMMEFALECPFPAEAPWENSKQRVGRTPFYLHGLIPERSWTTRRTLYRTRSTVYGIPHSSDASRNTSKAALIAAARLMPASRQKASRAAQLASAQ